MTKTATLNSERNNYYCFSEMYSEIEKHLTELNKSKVENRDLYGTVFQERNEDL